MDIFSELPKKHKVIMCYSFVGLIALTIAALTLSAIFANPCSPGVYMLVVVSLFGIFGWTLRGGIMQGHLGRDGVHIELRPAIHPENKTLPEIHTEKLTNKEEGDNFA